jgi:hypothetical protein
MEGSRMKATVGLYRDAVTSMTIIRDGDKEIHVRQDSG